MFDLSEAAVRTALPKMPMHHILVNFTGSSMQHMLQMSVHQLQCSAMEHSLLVHPGLLLLCFVFHDFAGCSTVFLRTKARVFYKLVQFPDQKRISSKKVP